VTRWLQRLAGAAGRDRGVVSFQVRREPLAFAATALVQEGIMDAKQRSVIGKVFFAVTVVDGGGNRRAVAWSAGRPNVQNPARACVTGYAELTQ